MCRHHLGKRTQYATHSSRKKVERKDGRTDRTPTGQSAVFLVTTRSAINAVGFSRTEARRHEVRRLPSGAPSTPVFVGRAYFTLRREVPVNGPEPRCD